MSDFRIKFITKDGSLIQNRPTDVKHYVDRWGKVDSTFVESVLRADAHEKGVRVVYYKFDKSTGVEAVVEWLK